MKLLKPACLAALILGAAIPALLPAQTATAPVVTVAPEIPTTRTTLFNGKDLTGWKLYLGTAATVPNTAPASEPAATAPKVWSIADGILKLDTKSAGYVITDKTYADYKLHVEWRWPKDANPRSNSGILLHINGPAAIWPSCYEAQLQTGNAGQITGMALDIPDAPMQNNRKRAARGPGITEKAFGEWNSYDITAKGDTLELTINGKPANKAVKLPAKSGAIALQMEGFPIEFQNIFIEPLPEPKP
jgi:hypothetical protein